MLKYCYIDDLETGLVQLGVGCSDEYYEEIGMKKQDVKQSDIDFQWYLSEKCPMKSEEQKKREEEERIQMLSMTKYDFYKFVLSPNGIDYSKLQEILHTNDEMNAAWQLCERVYRNDEFLCSAVKKYLPNVDLDKIFKERGH